MLGRVLIISAISLCLSHLICFLKFSRYGWTRGVCDSVFVERFRLIQCGVLQYRSGSCWSASDMIGRWFECRMLNVDILGCLTWWKMQLGFASHSWISFVSMSSTATWRDCIFWPAVAFGWCRWLYKYMSWFLFSFERNSVPKAVKANMSFCFYVFVHGRLAASSYGQRLWQRVWKHGEPCDQDCLVLRSWSCSGWQRRLEFQQWTRAVALLWTFWSAASLQRKFWTKR